MTDLRKAAEMALEILDMCFYDEDDELFCLGGWHQEKFTDAREALRQTLAQPEQEPVCFIRETAWSYEIAAWDDPKGFPVYTAPPKREWVGLTEEEFFDLLNFDGRLDHVETPLVADFIRAIQTKLKEKNT